MTTITPLCVLTVFAAVLSASDVTYASEAALPPGIGQAEKSLAALPDGARLFDPPSASLPSGQPGATGNNLVGSLPAYPANAEQTLVQFNGVLSHKDTTEIWLDGVPMSLWMQQRLDLALSLRWAPATNTLLVRLPGGSQRRLEPGQRLYRTINGELLVGDSAQ